MDLCVILLCVVVQRVLNATLDLHHAPPDYAEASAKAAGTAEEKQVDRFACQQRSDQGVLPNRCCWRHFVCKGFTAISVHFNFMCVTRQI